MDPNEQALMQKFTRKLIRACVPVFALGAACAAIAAAGLIRGGKCAAHWKTIARLGEQFPDVEFENVLFASDDKATSCAGELATFDLIVGFIEEVCGSRVSGDICNHFLACGKRSGGSVQLLSGDALICEDGRFQRVLEIMVNNIEEPVSTTELAHRLGLSRRQIERIFSRHGFEPPNKYYKNLRLQRARQLIEQTRMSLIEIAFACGFETQSSFSRNYKRTFGMPPNADRTHKAAIQIAQPPPPLAFVT
jgi:AraC family carnitine catabolism transcriptional activator